MRCIHGGDPFTCKTCNRGKEALFMKPSDPQRIAKYNDGIQEKKTRLKTSI